MRLPGESPVAACDLRSRVDGLAAARAEEDRRVVDGCKVRDSRGELESRRVRVVAEHVVRRERTELRRHRVRDLGTAVADVREPETCGRVQVLRSVDVQTVDPSPRASTSSCPSTLPIAANGCQSRFVAVPSAIRLRYRDRADRRTSGRRWCGSGSRFDPGSLVGTFRGFDFAAVEKYEARPNGRASLSPR